MQLLLPCHESRTADHATAMGHQDVAHVVRRDHSTNPASRGRQPLRERSMSSLWRPGLAEGIGHIYILQSVQFEELYKIGRSGFGKLDERFRALRVGHELRAIFHGVFFDYCQWEKALHRHLRTRRLPQSEYFRLSATEVKHLVHNLFFPCIERESWLEASQVTMQAAGGFLRLIDTNSLDEVYIRH